MLRRSPITMAALALAFVTFFPADGDAQPRFGIEAVAGTNLAFTPYVDNAVIVRDDIPLMGDESPGVGASFGLNFVFTELEAMLRLRFFDRDDFTIHHRGTERLPENRIRPDGSIDDSGITYEAVEPTRTIQVPDRTRGDLLLMTAGAGYRWYVVTGDFEFYVPAGGALVLTHIVEETRPYVFGLEANGGLGLTWRVAPPIGIVGETRLHGLLTPTYTRTADAARAAVTVGDSTEEAILSSMLYGTAMIGVQLTIR